MTLGTRIAIRSHTAKHFGILIDEPARAAHGNYHWEVGTLTLAFTIGNPETDPSPKRKLSQGRGGGIATDFRARALPNFRLSKKLIY